MSISAPVTSATLSCSSIANKNIRYLMFHKYSFWVTTALKKNLKTMFKREISTKRMTKQETCHFCFKKKTFNFLITL